MKKNYLLFLAILLICSAFSYHPEFPYTPDTTITQGSVCHEQDPDFEEYRYPENIAYCHRDVNRRTKQKVYRMYAIPRHCRHEYTIDHFVPLSIGGTNQIDNLWPEHKEIKAQRQQLEWEVYQLLRNGDITQQEAIEEIRIAKTSLQLNQIQVNGLCF